MKNQTSVSSGEGDNLRSALEAQLDGVDLRGRIVLIKPNIVDPNYPQACSDPEQIQTVVDVLDAHNPGAIFLGDEPALYVLERQGFDLLQAYEDLGYSNIRGVRITDLREAPTTEYKASRPNIKKLASRLSFYKSETESLAIPVRTTSNIMVVSMSMPKHHGNFNYSGVSKNLMGLVPAQARPANFHYCFFRAAKEVLQNPSLVKKILRRENQEISPERVSALAQKMMSRFADKYIIVLDEDKYPEDGMLAPVVNAYREGELDFNSYACHLNHIVNQDALIKLVQHIKRTSPDSLYILDGRYLLSYQEHVGEPVRTDFAVVGSDPLEVDLKALEKLGINCMEVPYLANMPYEEIRPEVHGNLGDSLAQSTLIPKQPVETPDGVFLAVR